MAVQTNVTPLGNTRRLAVGRNTLILLATNFSSAAFGLLIAILIGRIAGQAVLGAYSLALAWALTLSQFADLGMNTLLTRDLARRPEETANDVRASLLAKTGLGLALGLGLIIAAPVVAPGAEATLAVQLGAGLIVLNAWYGTFTAVMRAYGRMLPILVLNVGGLVIQAGLTWVLVTRGSGGAGLVLLAVLIQFAQLLGGWLFYSRAIAAGSPHGVDLPFVTRLLRAGLPFAIAGILAGVELRANLFLLGALQGDSAVGWYSAASRLNEGIRLAPNAFFGAMLPALAALDAVTGRARLDSFFRRGEWALIAFGAVATIALSLLAPFLIPLLYKNGFLPAVPVLTVLSWDLIPALVGGLLVLYLYARGDESFVNWLLAIGLGIQVLAAVVLIRLYSAPGAAAATLISDVILWYLLRQRISQLDRGTRFSFRAVALAALPPLVLFAVAVAFRLSPILRDHFDGLYGQDAYSYYGYARQLFRALTSLQAPPPFWWPLGYPLLLDAAFAVGGISVGSAQAVTVLTGALVAPLAYGLAREAAPTRYKSVAGWTAGLICACSGQLVQSSVVVMADAPALMWATLAAWLLVRYARTRGVWSLAVGALAAGLSVWTRWESLLFAGVWFVALLVIEWQHARPARVQGSAGWFGGLVRAGLAAILIAAVLAPQLFIRVATAAPLAGQSWLEGWSPANLFARSFDTVDGHFDFALPVAAFYAQALAHPAYLFAMFTPFLLLGGGLMLKHWQTNAGATLLLLGWLLAPLGFLMGIPYENFRFSLGFFVPAAVLAGIGAGWVSARSERRWTRLALSGWIAVGLLVIVVWEPRVFAPVLETKTREIAQTQWLAAQLPPNATVWTLGASGAIQMYTPLASHDLWQVSVNDITAHAPAYVFIDIANIESQWRGKEPQALYHALLDAGQLHPLGEQAGWTLFRVGE